MEGKISVKLFNAFGKEILSFETSKYESYDEFLPEARLECYKKIIEENAKLTEVDEKESSNGVEFDKIIPFGDLINYSGYNYFFSQQSSEWKFKFHSEQGKEISKDLAIFNWYIIKSFKQVNEENQPADFITVKNELEKLLTPIYGKEGLCILTELQINWLCAQNGFYEALQNINKYGNTKGSPCRTEKIYALSALTYKLSELKPEIQIKKPNEIEAGLSATSVKHKMPSFSPKYEKRKIWPKVLLISLGIILTAGAIALGLLTVGIGTSLLAGIGGVIGKAIGYITSHVLICGSIAGGAGLVGVGLTAAASVKLRKTIKYNETSVLLNEVLSNTGYKQDDEQEPNFQQKINSAVDKANNFNSNLPQQKTNNDKKNDMQTPLLPK